MLTKEEIARETFILMKGLSVAASKIRVIEDALQAYSDQQNSSLIKEVEELKRENEKLKVRLEHMFYRLIFSSV